MIGFQFDHTDIITPIGQIFPNGRMLLLRCDYGSDASFELIGCKNVCRVSALTFLEIIESPLSEPRDKRSVQLRQASHVFEEARCENQPDPANRAPGFLIERLRIFLARESSRMVVLERPKSRRLGFGTRHHSSVFRCSGRSTLTMLAAGDIVDTRRESRAA